MNDKQIWGWCEFCSTAYPCKDGLLPGHYLSGHLCHGSEKAPRELVTDDNRRVSNPDHKKGIEP
jgi:hypothetical protein